MESEAERRWQDPARDQGLVRYHADRRTRQVLREFAAAAEAWLRAGEGEAGGAVPPGRKPRRGEAS